MHSQLARILDKRSGNASDDHRLIGAVLALEKSTTPRYDWINELHRLDSTIPGANDLIFSYETLLAFIAHLEKTDYKDCLPEVWAEACKRTPDTVIHGERIQEYGQHLIIGLLQNKWYKDGRPNYEADRKSMIAVNLAEMLLRVIEARLNRPQAVG